MHFCSFCITNKGRDVIAVSTEIRLRAGWFKAQILVGQRDLIFKTSRLALGPTHPPIQWVLGALSWESSSQGMNMTAHLCLLPRLRISVAIPQLPIHAIMACIGSILPFHFLSSVIMDIFSSHRGRKTTAIVAFHTNYCRRNWKKLQKKKKLTDVTDFSCASSWLSWDILSLSFTIVSWRDVRHSLSILRSPSMLEFCTSFAAICCPSFRDDSSAAVRSLSHCLYLISHQHSGTGMGMGNKNQT